MEDHADFTTDGIQVGTFFEFDTVDDDFASARSFQVIQAAKNRTFTASGRSDNHDHFFFFDIKADIFKDRHISKFLRKMFDGDHRF